jgi:hypothetical protein
MEEEKILSEPEESEAASEQEKAKSLLQIQKEGWYDKLPLNLKQLDTIITVCWILIVLLIIVIALDAMDIFNPFGY